MFFSRISRQKLKLSITLISPRLFSSSIPSSSKLKEYSFKPPVSLGGGGGGQPYQNPNPNGNLDAGNEFKQNNKKKQKPLYRPPSSLDRTGLKPLHSDIPFDFRFSYTESSPIVRPIGLREPKYSPFGPGRLDRPWTGVCAPAIDPTVKSVDENAELELEEKRRKWRETIQGEPLTAAERKILVERCQRNRTKRQINLGRDGLTHNMLNDIHNHWKHTEAVRIKCLGVPTVDMKNVCIQLEDKTGGKIIHRQGGLVVLYRGRNYNPKKRPIIPLMLWKPHEPVYPKLVKTVIDGLTVEETKEMRKRGLAVSPLTKLAKNGFYGSLVPMVRDAFLVDELVRIDCKGLERSDYKKIGCKLRDLVPCILVTFEKEQVVVWRGKNYCPTGAGEFLSDREYFDIGRGNSDSECELHSSDSRSEALMQ
ncbi:CRS2-associated factor 1, mitochondrial isoform X1 [Macadamia integrifolia]|uniref:CRS2-associated factor 1, mitochondrial isoform X1 n=1 Tax=Macadamia integrifolia TaxID=60698 RepID=UPI001C500B83|nr:CRS2-associated factor 1, mitochondrial isoform X1 [Macadamia integrifolia]